MDNKPEVELQVYSANLATKKNANEQRHPEHRFGWTEKILLSAK